MTDHRPKTRVLRRMDTPENREYWAFVEKTARQVRSDAQFHRFVCGYTDGGVCYWGDGVKKCAQVIEENRDDA